MTTLRVGLSAPFDPSAPAAWWRVDAAGSIVDRGVCASAAWPAAERIEVALSASDVRTVALALPPMKAGRRAAAAAYALEDQLAAPADTLHIGVRAPGSRDEPTIAHIADRSAIRWLAERRPAIDHVVAETDLAAADDAWRWCIDADGRGFVRRPDGSAFAVDGHADAELPAELAAALAQSRRLAATQRPPRVVVDAVVTPERCAAWSQATGATFARGTPWSLERVSASAWANAPDLRDGFASAPTTGSSSMSRRLAPALALVACALALHAFATLAGWAQDRYAAWRADRAVVELARDAGIDPVPDARAADAALARRAAATLHASGRVADDDALSMIARAAGPLATLPQGSLRKLTYGDRRLVADLGALDDARLARLVRELAAAGLAPIAAPVGGGVRVVATPGS